MAPGLPARVAALCTLMIGVSVASAERRPVAVIDLTGDPRTEQLARQLGQELANHPDLQPVTDPAIPALLLGTDEDEDTQRLTEARRAKDEAEGWLDKFQFARAEEVALRAATELQHVAPLTSASALYAQLAFVLARAQLGLRRPADATAAFALAHRLDPGFTPDPARYLPDVVQAFDQAKGAFAGVARLTVTGTGRLWVDGIDRGAAPADLEVAGGPHVVWLTGPERQARAVVVRVVAGTPAVAAVPDAPADERLKIRRARAALRFAPDAAARAAAMKQLAELVGVRDAVLLSAESGTVIVQTWNAGTREHTPGFSALREQQDARPRELLAPLAPPRKRVVVPDEPPPKSLEPSKPLVTKRWYERRGVQASVAVGVLASVVGAFFIVRASNDDMVPLVLDFGPAP